jgi:phospholipase D1/2
MSFFKRAKVALHDIEEDTRRIVDTAAADIANAIKDEIHSHTHLGSVCHTLHQTVQNRYHSFAPPRTQDSAKWFVDGCGYFWALSVAIEEAQHEIWIMDWWLSPELYLRRPPSANEQYRLDRMLKAAADRGVKINVMIYKEVENVLTCKLPFLVNLVSSFIFLQHNSFLESLKGGSRIRSSRVYWFLAIY